MSRGMKLTSQQLHTLRHMLGINDPYARTPKPYRNYAAVNPGDQEFAELERLGAVERYTPRLASGYEWFRCTEAGKAAANWSHRAMRKTKPQRVYHSYLSCRDCYSDLTFKEFLTNDAFKEIRARA